VLDLPEHLHAFDAFDAWAAEVAGQSSFVRVGGKKGKKGKNWKEDMLDTISMSLDEVKELLKDRRKLTVQLKSAGWWNIDFPLPELSVLTGIVTSGSEISRPKFRNVVGTKFRNVAMYSTPLNYWGSTNAKIEVGGRFRILVAVNQDFQVWLVINGKKTLILPKVTSSPDLGGELSLGELAIPAAAVAA
jgi:hypothetical protein